MMWSGVQPGDMVTIGAHDDNGENPEGYLRLFQRDTFMIIGVQTVDNMLNVLMLTSGHRTTMKKHLMDPNEEIHEVFNVFRRGEMIN